MQKSLKTYKYNFAIIYGSTRKNRLGIRFVNYINNQIKLKGHKTNIVDPLVTKLPLLDKRYSDYKKSSVPKNLKKIQQSLNKSHAFIVISAEYNHMPPPALFNIFDYYYAEFNRKPSCVCTYSSGDLAGVRVQSPIRAMLSQLGCPPIKFGMFQPRVSSFFDKNGKPSDVEDAEKRFNLFFDELLWYTKVLQG
tara:strand:+ start:100 stop:678 length:579 start_codon:yes stop_codon:yes gene_type:complete